MYPSNHIAALTLHVLAPGPAPSPNRYKALGDAFAHHFTPGGILLGLVILAVAAKIIEGLFKTVRRALKGGR